MGTVSKNISYLKPSVSPVIRLFDILKITLRFAVIFITILSANLHLQVGSTKPDEFQSAQQGF